MRNLKGELKMSENEKKHDGHSCCCCQSWKAIFIAIAFMAIGALLCHTITMMHRCGHMKGLYGDDGMKACRDRGEMEGQGKFEHNSRQGNQACDQQKGGSEHKSDMGKCKPGCTCPMCSKKAASLSEPNKAACPMMDKKKGKAGKD
jgi:hypothetical protein